MELSGTESDALYDNGHEQNKIKVNDCITSKMYAYNSFWKMIS